MAKAIALARTHVPALPLGEMARVALVTGCGLAAIFAGPAMPF